MTRLQTGIAVVLLVIIGVGCSILGPAWLLLVAAFGIVLAVLAQRSGK